jgi:hypothetical protein
MGKGRGGGAPQIDPAVTAYNTYLLDRQKLIDKRDDDNALEATRATNEIKTRGETGYTTYKQNLLNQFNAGLIDTTQAQQGLKDYEDRYKLGAGYTQADLNSLTEQATSGAAGKSQLLAGQTYKDILGREAKTEELTTFADMQKTGKYSLSDLVNTIKSGEEYRNKFEQNYLNTYNDIMYGKQETEKSADGTYDIKTGRRTFNYNSAFDPTFAGDLTKSTDISTEGMPTSFTGTVGEIEEFQTAQRQKRDFMYNAGLTNLQGQIDKDTQKIKNEGSRDVAKIGTQGQMLSNLTSGFWS